MWCLSPSVVSHSSNIDRIGGEIEMTLFFSIGLFLRFAANCVMEGVSVPFTFGGMNRKSLRCTL